MSQRLPFPTKYASGTFSFDVVSVYPQPDQACLLLVDDDPLVLSSLGRALAERRWTLVTATDAQAALRAIEERSVDVVISDMNMESMSGATLLGAVQQRRPDIVRIILSGNGDPKHAFRAVPFAHQFLAKPIDVDVLKWTIRRACGLRSLLTNSAIRAAVGSSNELPAAPSTYLRLKQILRDPDVSINEVAQVVERDVGIAARVLQLVSSAFFGLPRRVKTLSDAVSYLGIDTLRTLVLALEIVRMFREGGSVRGFSLEALQRHSFVTAKLARGFADAYAADDAYVAGMLHSVGKLVLAERVPARYTEVLDRTAAERARLSDVEREVLGASHADVGGYLLGLWGLPQRVVEAVTEYQAPWRLDPTRLGIAGAVHVASILADHPDAPLHTGGADVPPGQLSAEYLDRAGVLGTLGTWRALARRAAA
ncbi:MAG TPA: response regulator [Polyangiaceae bacterium]|nr:response regulator [Polyangiaceae bacterium]